MKRYVFAAVTMIAALAASTGSASAHANLLHSNIKNNQTFARGHAPKEITGFFAENLDPASWMAVFEGVGDHGLVTEKQHSKINFKNPQEMILKLPKLNKDKYYLIWHTKSAQDGHIAAGIVYFSVK